MSTLAIGYETGAGPGPTGPCGQAMWAVKFYVTSQSGQNPNSDHSAAGGWVVQKITTTYNLFDCNDQPANPATNPLVYYEAWQLQADGRVHASPNSWDNWDAWNYIQRDNLKGSIKTLGEASFHRQFRQGEMTPGGVTNAGGLHSSTNRPANLAAPTLTREMTVEWDCCGGNRHPKVSALAYNRWDTYRESWGFEWFPETEGGPQQRHRKVVDGVEVP